ncbi:helix-turn-helix domain-containing protein [Nonomuraea sp. NPDC026600]|uniref:AraC-like ligand-binding domain-containing protein n=1 Tax=Nonomuraea sp. NPDC026600 TaxID=3155363 RepID=UPI0033D66ECA
MRELIRMDELPVSDRFAAYRELLAKLPAPLDVRSERPAGFWAELAGAELGALSVASLFTRTGAPYEVHRTPSLISRSDPEAYRLVLNMTGHSGFTQNQRDARLGPGDLALYDTSLPFHGWHGADAGTHHWVMVTFPHSLLAMRPATVRALLGARLPGREGVGTLTAGFVARLARDIDQYRPLDAPHISAALMDLLMGLLGHELGTPAPEPSGQALLLQIQAHIQRNLGDPALSPKTIATGQYISVRSLHRLFQAHGLTVAGWVRARRLERCRADLADPLQWFRPVHAIAARWGFTNRAHFSNLFRAAYGVSPLNYRTELRTLPGPPAHVYAGRASSEIGR